MPGTSDSELVAAALDGEVESFTELCRRYYPAMAAISHNLLHDMHLAEDAAQETFARAVERLGSLKDGSKVGFWLASICRNTARDMLLARKREKCGEDLSNVSARNENGQCEEVYAAIRQLPPAEQELIFLRYYHEMSYEQMGSVLRLSAEAINGRLRRAKKKLESILMRNEVVDVKQ